MNVEVLPQVEADAFLPPPTPFQTPEWLSTWWKHFGSGSLRTLVFRHAAETVGVMPCFVHEWNGRRQVTLVGTGISDYVDPLFDGRYTDEIVDCIREQLNGWTDWDVCLWQDLSAGTPLAALGRVEAETPCSAVQFRGSFDEYLAARPKDLKRNLRRYREKAEAIAPVTFEASDAADHLDTLIALHGVRWRSSGESGMIEANGSEAFLREVTPLLANTGSIRFFTIRFGDRIAAILLALCNATTIFSYLSAFDPEFDAFGFGRELLAQALRYAHENGYTCWNFLRGDEPYKFSWGAEPIAKCRVVIER